MAYVGKTETIMKRAILVYLPTLAQKAKWTKLAKKAKTSASKWIIQTVENSLMEKEGETVSKDDLLMENLALKKEISRIQNELRIMTLLRENQEQELRKYRAEPFLSPSFEGVRQYNKNLIDLLRNTEGTEGKLRYVSNDEILQRLSIGRKEEEAIQAVSNQLTFLEAYGLIESSTKGWRWKA